MQFKVSSDPEANNNNYLLNKRGQAQRQIPFKGIESIGNIANQAFAQIQTNKIVEYTAVDAVSMVIPRTVVDYTRSEDAGNETLRREVSAAATECLIPGIFAAGVGFMLGKVINPKLNINTALPIETDTLKMFSKSWNVTNPANGTNFYSPELDKEAKQKYIQNFIEDVFIEKTEGLVGKADEEIKGEGWLKIKDKSEEFKSLFGKLAGLIVRDKKATREELNAIKTEFVSILGASESIRVDHEGSHIKTTANSLIDGIYNIGRMLATVGPENTDAAIEKIEKINPKKAAIVMGTLASFGFFQQFFNRHMTKKKSGSDAFVGLSEEDRKASNSQNNGKSSKTKLNIAKALSVAGIMGIAASGISNSCKPETILKTIGSPSKLIKKLEFNGWFPHVNQLRAIYAVVIAGRMLAATDKHELRETDTRDIPGFLNWLVIGGFVSKGFAKWISKGELINSSEKAPDGKWGKIKHFFKNASLTTHSEIDARQMTVEKAKEILTKFGKKIDSEDAEKIITAAKTTLKHRLNGSLFAGLAYSTLMLGLFMPTLNKYITKKLTQKKKQPENLNISDNNKPSIKDSAKNPTNYKNNENFSDFIEIQKKLRKS